MSPLRPSMSTSTSSSPLTSNEVTTKTTSSIVQKNGKLQIFLGGSCNPTTWRQNLAIPFLDTHGISYYNPQVENWTPEVIDVERHAKQNAQILLFVIDRQTRSTVSLVESAFMAGQNKNLVLVVNPFDDKNVSEDHENATSAEEFQELKHARHLLQSLVAKRKIPMFSDILNALYYISRSLRNDSQTTEVLLDDKNHLATDNSSEIDGFDFRENVINDLDLRPLPRPSNPAKDHEISDVCVYLDENGSTNIKTTSIDIFRDKELTFSMKDVRSMTEASIGGEIYKIKNSRVLLFVITSQQRGLSIMVLASHLMALYKDDVVLCVQYLEEPCYIGDELMTKTAIADYNRGRVYLCDYAVKYQVPVFSTLREAIDCCIQKCITNNKVT